MNIRDAIKKAVETGAEIYSVVGTIKSVDKSKRTCVVEPVDGSPEIFGVRYTATESDAVGFIANPANGAFVVVTFLDDNNAFVSLVTEIETFVINNDSGDLKQIMLDLIAMIEKNHRSNTGGTIVHTGERCGINTNKTSDQRVV